MDLSVYVAVNYQPFQSIFFNEIVSDQREIMSNKEDIEKNIHSHNFQICSFCGKKANDVEVIIVASDEGPSICNECVRLCETMLEGKKRDCINYRTVPGELHAESQKQLRLITQIPKDWVVCETNLYASHPSVVACSTDGTQTEHFFIPKPLALWMLSTDQKIDMDKMRKEVKKDILDSIRQHISKY